MDAAEIRRRVLEAGASACGIARVEPLTEAEYHLHESWVASGKHGEMSYLENYAPLRHDPATLLDGAKSIIVAAFNYYHRDNGPLRWARYALGRDYHEEVRERLSAVASRMEGESRVTVDTAPLRERLWAVKAGVGFTGLNGLLIVPGTGSWVVLGEILTTLDLEPDRPLDSAGCGECGLCVSSCPGGALDGCGGMDARRCRSYLSIEYRGDDIPSLGGRVYGCDICQEVCPHNRNIRESEIFVPRPEVTALTRERILEMSQEQFSRIFSHSAIKRTKSSGLRRNALRLGTEGRHGDAGSHPEGADNLADGEA